MNSLIDELFACEMPNTSISGKPIISTFTLEELLQRFEK
jgi:DNA mismatch repair protein MutL